MKSGLKMPTNTAKPEGSPTASANEFVKSNRRRRMRVENQANGHKLMPPKVKLQLFCIK